MEQPGGGLESGRWPILDPEHVEALQMDFEAFPEGGVRTARERGPSDIRKRGQSGEGHVFGVLGRRHVFAPELPLHAEDVPDFFRR